MKDFWKQRWEEKNTPWQQAKVEPLLERYFPREPKHVFVPLCGKSLDLLWLAHQGHSVVGSELSELACREFFSDHDLPVTEQAQGPHKIFRSGSIELWAGDFFELPMKTLHEIDTIYDRASLYALPPGDIRDRYVAKINEIALKSTSTKFEILLLGRETDPAPKEGPPFMISKADIEKLFADKFKIEVLERMARDSRADIPGKITETAYRLTRN